MRYVPSIPQAHLIRIKESPRWNLITLQSTLAS